MTSTDPAPTGAGTRSVGGARPTRQRLAVVDALGRRGRSGRGSPARCGSRRGGERVGLATVYRTLQRLAEAGEVDMLRTEDGEALWRACSATHHHHLVCRSCGATVEVEGPAVERWTGAIAAEHGYTDVSHTLEIFGTCPRC